MSDARPDPSETAPALAMTPDWMRLLQADRMDVLAAALRAWLARHGRRVTVAWRTGPDGAVRTEPTGSGIELDPSLPSRLRPGEYARLPCGAGVVKLAGDVPDLWVMVADVNGANDAAALPEIDVVQALAAHVLERDRLRQAVVRLERAEGLQRALYEITDMASSGLDMPAMLSGLHRIVGRLMYAENFFIALYDADLDAIRFIYFADVADDEWQDPDAVDPMSEIEGSLTWHLIRHARPLMGPTSRLYEQVSGPLAIIGPGAADWLGVPIVIDGHVRGALVVQSYDRGDLYTPVERDLLTYVGTHIVTAIDRKRAFDRLEQQTHELERQIDVRRQVEQRLQHEVMHDPLTGLPNRAYLREHLARAMAAQARDPSQCFAVLFLDLDRFKVINDSAGHVVGDELLKVVARRFSDCLRTPDIVARLGGDEFAIVMHGITGSDAPARLARRLIDAMHEPVRVQDKELFSGVSIGIALGSPSYTAPEQLLRDADIAMYRVKERARGGFEMFDEQLHRQALELLALESELRAAASRDEFLPHFQPIVRLADGAVVGYEALMRWQHPTRGLLAPAAFLRAAEACGVLETLDWQLYESVFRSVPSLLRDGQYVSLNVSPRHFLVHELDERLLALMQRHGVRPEQVRIEITEGALIENPARVGACIDRLRLAGVYTALDDFGTGYSSMSYLHRFRFHTIKLDRSFIADLGPGGTKVAAALVRAAVDLSRALDLEVIAEGIETDEQRDAVRALGCSFGQGYRFARPAAASVFSAPVDTPA